MKDRQIPFLPIIFMLALVAAAYGLYKNVTFEQIDFDVGLSDEARKNRLLAAGQLLELEGFEFNVAADRRVFSDLNIKSTGVLWLANVDVLEDEREAKQILAWIDSGGILLASSRSENPFSDTTVPGWFMQQLGIEQLNDAVAEDLDILDDWTEGEYTLTIPDSNLNNPDIDLFNETEPYFKISSNTIKDTRTIIDSRYLIHRQMGQGYYSMYANYRLFDNAYIDEFDQGYLLMWLTQPAKTKAVTIVFQPASKPGLFTLLWNQYTLAICIAALVLIGFLRWAAARLGPVEQELPPIKNNIMAHLEARANYWYRHKHTNKVIASVRQATLDQLRTQSGKHVHDGDDAINKTAAIKQASALLQCTPEQAEKTLFGKTTNKASILRTVRALQRLNHRKQLKSK